LLADGRLPGQIVEKVIAVLAVETLGVVGALALAVHHIRPGQHVGQRQTSGRVSITRARATHHHVVNGVVVLFLQKLFMVTTRTRRFS